MTVQCAHCLRVYVGGEWVRVAPIEVDVTGFCPPCGYLRADKMSRDYVREGKRLLRQRKAGYGPGSGDAFKGFRGTE